MGQFNHFKVLWRHKGRSKERSQDYRAPDLKTVLRMLNKSHNVSPATTDYMYVHLIKSNGEVVEVLTHEEKDHKKIFDQHVRTRTPKQTVQLTGYDHQKIANIKDIIEKNRSKHNKPRVRLTNPPTVVLCDAPVVQAACGLYEAQPAVR